MVTKASPTHRPRSHYTAPAPVPGPLPLFGAAAAFGFSRKLRKRIQESRLTDGSCQPLA